MRPLNKKIQILAGMLATILFVGLLFPGRVYAYVDPGSGSYFFQVMLGLLLGSSFGIKTFRTRVIKYFGKLAKIFNRKKKDNDK